MTDVPRSIDVVLAQLLEEADHQFVYGHPRPATLDVVDKWVRKAAQHRS